MPNRIIFSLIVLLVSLNLSYGQENIPSSYYETIDPPLYGIVIKGDNVIINTEIPDILSKKNIASFVKPQTLAIITSIHKSLPYVYIETESIRGWFNQNYIQIISPEEFDKIFNLQKILLIKPILIDDVVYPPATKLPILKEYKKSFKVLISTSDGFIEKHINKKLATKPLKPRLSNLKMLTKIFNKKPYVWANNEEGWDCSGLIQDMFSFFDIQLPRNSFDQINYSDSIDVSDRTLKDKEKILRQSKPYFTFIYFPGHIMLYTGKRGKDYLTFQALSRIDEKKIGYVGFFPLKKTGLLKKVTKIGYISLNKLDKKYSSLNHPKEDL